MYRAKFHADSLVLGDPLSNVCVVSGWTPIPKLLSILGELNPTHIEPAPWLVKQPKYAVIGPLYKPALGLSWLVRNLLLNPQIDTVLLVADTKADEVAETKSIDNFFHIGVIPQLNIKGWQVPYTDYFIHGEIPSHTLHELVQHIHFEVVTLTSVSAKVSQYYNPASMTAWLPPRDFPLPQGSSELEPLPALPALHIGHSIVAEDITEAWLSLVSRVYRNGLARSYKQGVEWKELLNMSVTVLQPSSSLSPHPLLDLAGDFLTYYKSSFTGEKVAEGTAYTYGIRLRQHFNRDQLNAVVEKLSTNTNSTHALCSVYDSYVDHENPTPPCLTQVWFRVQDNKLTMTATFRSHEVYSAWASNSYGLAALQELVLNKLQVSCPHLSMGSLTVLSFSAHLYDWAYEQANEVALHALNKKVKAEFNDPVGNFLIRLNGDLLTIEQEAGGVVLNTFQEQLTLKQAQIKLKKLLNKVIKANPSIQAMHSAYLGGELQRVLHAYKEGIPFHQDSNV